MWASEKHYHKRGKRWFNWELVYKRWQSCSQCTQKPCQGWNCQIVRSQISFLWNWSETAIWALALLFSLFIEDWTCKKQNGNVAIDLLMYADDIVLMSSNEEGLRKHLRSLEEFCKQWKSVDKTKVCAFGTKPRSLSHFSFKGSYWPGNGTGI